jgi:hypothetical protein
VNFIVIIGNISDVSTIFLNFSVDQESYFFYLNGSSRLYLTNLVFNVSLNLNIHGTVLRCESVKSVIGIYSSLFQANSSNNSLCVTLFAVKGGTLRIEKCVFRSITFFDTVGFLGLLYFIFK